MNLSNSVKIKARELFDGKLLFDFPLRIQIYGIDGLTIGQNSRQLSKLTGSVASTRETKQRKPSAIGS